MRSRTDARKVKLNSAEVWERFKTSQFIQVARGKEVDVFNPDASSRDTIVKVVMGRSGNLRAPTLQIGDTYFVGYNVKLYDAILTL